MLADFISFQIDFSEQTQRYCVGVTAIVKVTLRDGVYHEDVGFGMLDNCRQKGMALDKVTRSSPIIPWYDTN
jgi:DNA repair and recombination protein RAD52